MSSKKIKSPFGRRKPEGRADREAFNLKLARARELRATMERGEQIPDPFLNRTPENYTKPTYSMAKLRKGPKTES